MKISDKECITLPVVALRGIVVFPGQMIHFDVGRDKSIKAINKATDCDSYVFLVTQRNMNEDTPSIDSVYRIGVVCKVLQTLKVPGKKNLIHVSVEGQYRAKIVDFNNSSYIKGSVVPIKSGIIKKSDYEYSVALTRYAKDLFADYLDYSPEMPADVISSVMDIQNPGQLADYIAGNIMLEYSERQSVLEIVNPIKRLEQLCRILATERELLSLEREISDKVQAKIDKNQKEYYLSEQLKTISEELNGFSQEDDVSSYKRRINSLNASVEVKNKLLKECSRLEKMSPSSPDAAVARTYIENCIELPWGVYSKEICNIVKSSKILNDDHYGLEKVKSRILEYLAVSTISPDIKGQIICLVGPPGVGKTSVAKSIARATGRNYVRIALGGVKDEAEIRGHRRTYIGSMPGRIIEALRKSGSSNPLILLDEVDKLSADYKGDPTSALLEVLDPEQNFEFNDHYIDLPFDLSKVLFVTTANVRSNIPEPLQDRMEIIELGSYTFEEKFNIAKKHLIPKQIKRHGLKCSDIKITDKAVKDIIQFYTREAGVRVLEQKIASICRKSAVKFVDGCKDKQIVDANHLYELLGSPKYKEDDFNKEPMVGVCNGLAWTSVGGEMLEIESAVLDGSGKLELTGSIGDIMQESAKTAVSYIRSVAKDINLSSDFYKTKDIHIHFPEGATPKDGPSAGITIATSLVSALSGMKIRNDIAMTGEITLRGRVLPIGGLKEKSMAAYRSGIKTVYIPKGNLADLDEVDNKVKENITFVPVDNVLQVWQSAIIGYNFDV